MSEVLPGFLLIGAMKAGTTTLYHALRAHPELYLPPEKEPEDLCHDDVLTPAGRARYARKFKRAAAGVLAGEASTAYSKRSQFPEVAARALHVLGPDLRILFMTRDPFERAISQYRHEVALRRESRTIEEALLNEPAYWELSRYDWQLEPWRAVFGIGAVLTVRFEDFVTDPQPQLDRVFTHLGVSRIDLQAGHWNAAAGRRVAKRGSLGHRVMRNPVYQHVIKPRLPKVVHRLGKRALLEERSSSAPLIPARLSEDFRTRCET